MKITEEQKDKFIQDMSSCLNSNGAFKIIQDCSVAHMNIELDNDSDVWHRIEEAIANAIIEFNEQITKTI